MQLFDKRIRTLCRVFYDIVAAMDRDWSGCVIKDSYSTMITAAAQSRRCSFVLIGIHILAGFFLSVGAYAFRSMSNTDSEVSREFPIKMEFSFVVESPLFECILVTQIVCLLSIASVVGMINALLATLVSTQRINLAL